MFDDEKLKIVVVKIVKMIDEIEEDNHQRLHLALTCSISIILSICQTVCDKEEDKEAFLNNIHELLMNTIKIDVDGDDYKQAVFMMKILSKLLQD